MGYNSQRVVVGMKKRSIGYSCFSIAIVAALVFHRPVKLRALYNPHRHPGGLSHFVSTHRGHAHNDYEHPRPLQDALDNHFRSVEADVWLVGGQIQVSHYGLFYSGSLKDLYLDPLQQKVNSLGSVQGDQKPFLLWLDIKDENPELPQKLQELLANYPMLTRYVAHQKTEGPVSIVLTGRGSAKRRYIEKFTTRFACRDNLRLTEGDPNFEEGWCWYSLHWPDYIAWDGNSQITEDQKLKLQSLVKLVHSKHRKVRFWDAPDNEAAWNATEVAGADLIHTDQLDAMRSFFEFRLPNSPSVFSIHPTTP